MPLISSLISSAFDNFPFLLEVHEGGSNESILRLDKTEEEPDGMSNGVEDDDSPEADAEPEADAAPNAGAALNADAAVALMPSGSAGEWTFTFAALLFGFSSLYITSQCAKPFLENGLYLESD